MIGPGFAAGAAAIMLRPILIGLAVAAVLLVGAGYFLGSRQQPRCVFDRNEPGPQGWWWEIYKCSDGSERRELVASPRG